MSDDLMSSEEAYKFYLDTVKRASDRQVDLGAWLPSFRKFLRPLKPGEVCGILADTGVGKTAIVQNIILSHPNLRMILFELEVPPDLVVERYLSMLNRLSGAEIEEMVRAGKEPKIGHEKWKHAWACKRFGLSVEQMERIVTASQTKIGGPANVVFVDYIGLVRGKDGSRYEKITQVAEDIKTLAMTTQTVVFVTSQIRRLQADEEVDLHSAKDSGQIENSSGVLISATRTFEKPREMIFKVHKSTKGGAGNMIKANFDGPSLRIWE